MRNLLYIIILTFLFSCTKGGGNVYVEGRVYNPITGNGIKGIEIDLLRNKLGGAVGAQSGGVKLCELVYTDENGHFEIKHTGGLQSYYVQALPNAEDYYGIGWINISTKNKTYPIGGGSFTVKKGKNMHADFRLVPYGYLKLSLHNINCQGAADLIILERNNLTIPSYDGYSPMNFPGCYDYDASDCAKVPSGEWQYKWTVIRNGTTTYHDTTFLLNEGECAWIKVNY